MQGNEVQMQGRASAGLTVPQAHEGPKGESCPAWLGEGPPPLSDQAIALGFVTRPGQTGARLEPPNLP